MNLYYIKHNNNYRNPFRKKYLIEMNIEICDSVIFVVNDIHKSDSRV